MLPKGTPRRSEASAFGEAGNIGVSDMLKTKELIWIATLFIALSHETKAADDSHKPHKKGFLARNFPFPHNSHKEPENNYKRSEPEEHNEVDNLRKKALEGCLSALQKLDQIDAKDAQDIRQHLARGLYFKFRGEQPGDKSDGDV